MDEDRIEYELMKHYTLIPVLLLVLWIVGWTEAILAIAGL